MASTSFINTFSEMTITDGNPTDGASFTKEQLEQWAKNAAEVSNKTDSDSGSDNETKTKSTRKQRKTKNKQKRGENQPKRPMSAYMLFLNENRAAIKAKLLEDNEKVSVGEIARAAGLQWMALEDTAKDVFIEKAITLKEEYAAAMETWRTEHPEEAEAPKEKKEKRRRKRRRRRCPRSGELADAPEAPDPAFQNSLDCQEFRQVAVQGVCRGGLHGRADDGGITRLRGRRCARHRLNGRRWCAQGFVSQDQVCQRWSRRPWRDYRGDQGDEETKETETTLKHRGAPQGSPPVESTLVDGWRTGQADYEARLAARARSTVYSEDEVETVLEVQGQGL